jgi:hypothetical protein
VANLGYEVSDQTVGDILKRHGIPPVPERQKATTLKTSAILTSSSGSEVPQSGTLLAMDAGYHDSLEPVRMQIKVLR